MSESGAETNVHDRNWVALQPALPRRGRVFCFCPPFILCVLPLAFLGYFAGALVAFVLAFAVVFAYMFCGYCCCSGYLLLQSWRCLPARWATGVYVQILFLAYQAVLLPRKRPGTGPKDMPVTGLRPKHLLKKCLVDYALNVRVPVADEEEFSGNAIEASKYAEFFEQNLFRLPMWDRFDEFGPEEDPVVYVMRQLGSVYPVIYQDWPDKQSDDALTRFAFYGLGAHRIESVVDDGRRLYVVRTNALSALSVRDGFARYGGDAYFDERWRPVKIVDGGLAEPREDGPSALVTTLPGQDGWAQAKFRFRSSLAVLVTLVDHLYGVHLQTSNLMLTAVREQMSEQHPIRRFLTPFTFQGISVNDRARINLVQPRTMAMRCFGLTEHGLQMAFAAAPSLLTSGVEVPPEDGGPILSRFRYVAYLKEKRGIDTEYFRQSARYAEILRRFLALYVEFYYPSPAVFLADDEMTAVTKQFFHQVQTILPGSRDRDACASPEETYQMILDLLVNFIFLVTAGHEQVGAVEAYVQDCSFCAFKWTPGSLQGTKQTATAQALLMSFTSLPMPMLLGSDWTHLFPHRKDDGQIPSEIFASFQQDLLAFSKECDAYDEQAPERDFPENFPMYVMNPKRLETSISV